MGANEKLQLVANKHSPFVYKLMLHGAKKKRSIKEKLLKNKPVHFTSPVTLNKTPKLYIIRNTKGKKNVLYVGYADQGIGTRMRYGLNPKHQKNYHGYGWMLEDEVELLVWVFQPFKDKSKQENEHYNNLLKKSVECIEAEVVFYVRKITGEWPESQTEIHFGNANRKEVMRMKGEIVDWLKDN